MSKFIYILEDIKYADFEKGLVTRILNQEKSMTFVVAKPNNSIGLVVICLDDSQFKKATKVEIVVAKLLGKFYE